MSSTDHGGGKRRVGTLKAAGRHGVVSGTPDSRSTDQRPFLLIRLSCHSNCPERCSQNRVSWRGQSSQVLASRLACVQRNLIIELAARHRLPTVYFERLFVAGGGLISYGADLAEGYRRAAGYVDRILKGEKPADLPVQAPTKYELAINLKTAKALGLTIPPAVLARADTII